MITKPDIVDLLKKSKNRYELVNIISKRARQLNGGQEPMVETEEKAEVTVASEEFYEGKFQISESDNNRTEAELQEIDEDNSEQSKSV